MKMESAPAFDGPPPAAPPTAPPTAPPSYAQAVGAAPTKYVYHSVRQEPAILTTVIPVGPSSTHMICPHCLVEIDTAIKSEPGLIAYLLGTVICLVGFWCGCCLIPCCMDKCMDIHHSCPNCKTYLGKFRR